MTESNEPTNASPDPIQPPAQNPVPAEVTDVPASAAPQRFNRKLIAGVAGAAVLVAVAGISGYAIGNAAEHDGRGDGAGVSHFEAYGAPVGPDGMRGGRDGVPDGDGDGRFADPGGDRHRHGHRGGGLDTPGHGTPGHDEPGHDIPGRDFDGPAETSPSAPATPNP